MGKGDGDAAYQGFAEAAEFGEKFNDPDLRALSALSCGQALIQKEEAAGGVVRLDEAMLAVITAEVSPNGSPPMVSRRSACASTPPRSQTRS